MENILNEDLTELEIILNAAIKNLEEHKIPFEYKFPNMRMFGSDFGTYFNIISKRDIVIQKQGYALISESWVNPLVDWIGNRKCVELMSGLGTLAKVLNDKGVSCIATDNASWKNFTFNNWCDIVHMDCCEAIKEIEADVYICSWPYMDNDAYRLLATLREYRPLALLVYIGEWRGGCTANDMFFESAIRVEDKAFEKVARLYTSWPNIYDNLYLLK